MDDHARPQIAINDEDGRPVGRAEIEVVDDSVVRASLHVESGHLQPGTRRRLVDAVLDAPEVRSRDHLQATVPIGDAEMLDRVRDRSDHSETRGAGASCLIDADLPAQDGPPAG
jgi:hypothetical protein